MTPDSVDHRGGAAASRAPSKNIAGTKKHRHSEPSEDRFLSARFLRGESWLDFNLTESHETRRKTT